MVKFPFALLTLFVVNISILIAQDTDFDSIDDSIDNCPNHYNVLQKDFDEDGIGDFCDPNTIVISVDEDFPVGHKLELLEHFEPNTTTISIQNDFEGTFEITTDLKLQINSTLNFDDQNVYHIPVLYTTDAESRSGYIILYLNFILKRTEVEAVQVEEEFTNPLFEKYILYDPYALDISEELRFNMGDVKYAFGGFFGNGPKEEIALEHDLNNDSLNDLVFNSGKANYHGYIFNTGHLGTDPLYMVNLGGMKFELRTNPFENRTLLHSSMLKNVVDLNDDGKPEILSFGEHYHITRHLPYFQLVRDWLKSNNIIYGKDYNEEDFKKFRYFGFNENGEIIDQIANVDTINFECFYSFYQNGSGDIDNDGDIDVVFGAQTMGECRDNLGERVLGILRNDGNGKLQIESIGNGDFETSEGHLLLVDINEDDYLDIIFNNQKELKYILNDGAGSFNYDLNNSVERLPNGTRNIFYSDLNKDGKSELLVFNSSGFGNPNFDFPPNLIKVYHFENLSFTDVTNHFFNDEDNVMDFFTPSTFIKLIDLDNDGHKDIVPRFSVEDESQNWNGSNGFQYFKFDSTSQKFSIVDLGEIGKTFDGNHGEYRSTYNQFDFYDLDNDGVLEWMKFGIYGPYADGSDDNMRIALEIYKLKNPFNDRDGDGILNQFDNCVDNENSDQLDSDNDGIGDACDEDLDGDGVLNELDNCPYQSNRDQIDTDSDGIGDICDEFPLSINHDEVLKIVPNPSTGHIKLHSPNEITSFTISTMSGKTIQSSTNTKNVIDVSELKPGIYIIEVITDHSRHNMKFIKE
jgi:hypothetical protein